MTEVLILAAFALFVLSRLYVALGRDDGPPNGTTRGEAGTPQPAPAQADARQLPSASAIEPDIEPSFTGPAAGGLEEVYRADRSFNPRAFLQGARSAYEMIVGAFADGDRQALRPLLDDDVYEAWDAAITERETTGADPWRLLRIKITEIEAAEVEEGMARVMVRYEAELGDGEKTRLAKEIWTFKRETASSDPNWLLDDVEVSS
ncbi:MAG: Tim44/TimA family putative adaptor protein [Pseudomonadota bacterium]